MIELLVVIAIIAILAGMLLPTLAKAKLNGQSAVCNSSSLKQLQLAWRLYADDNEGRVPGNVLYLLPDGDDENRGGWVFGNAQRDSTDENLKKGDLWSYVGVARVYRCPSDRSTVRNKPSLPRSRSYGLEGSINLTPGPGISVPRILRKDSDAISPSANFGFVDVAAGSISGGALGIAFDTTDWIRNPSKWVHRPSDRHGQGANLSFLDGHVESKRWRYPLREKVPLQVSPPRNPADKEDLEWLTDRTYVGQLRR